MRVAVFLLGFYGVALFGTALQAAPIRVDGLNATPRDRISIYTVRGAGVSTPLIAFQERARRLLEAHMHVEIVSMRESLVRGGADLNKQLAACKAEPVCYSKLLGRTVDTRYLLVLTATRLDEIRLAGARLLDLKGLRVLGESIDEVPINRTILDAIDARVEACVPKTRWEPFGGLEIQAGQPGAQVQVQGRAVGMTPMRDIGFLLPGTYQVEVRKLGFIPAKGEFKVRQGEITHAALDLAAVPEAASSRWWLWAGAGVAVVGAAVLGAVLVGGSGGDPTFCSAPDPAACM